MQLILILLLSFITVTGQTKLIQPIDSVHVKVSIEELKYITLKFIELDAVKYEKTLLISEVGLLKRTIDDKDKIISLRDQIIAAIKEQMEAIKPSWYDRFTIGFSSAVAVVIGLLLLLK
ncbi:MAG: hypothetical protein WC879_03320 [Melioribacteraceae bacterium]